MKQEKRESIESFGAGNGKDPHMHDTKNNNNQHLYQQGKCVISPEYSKFLRKWDLVTTVALIFVCFVSPFEVSFPGGDKDMDWLKEGADGLFWVNRMVDSIFVFDMGLQFFTMYPIERQYGTVYIGDHRLIVRHYLKSWFCIDIVSILPFDLISILMQDAKDFSQLKMLRMIRLLRLLKLARLFRGMRIIKRWEVECDIQYRKLSLFGLVVTVIVSAHWLSCLLGLIDSVQASDAPTCTSPEQDHETECTWTWLTPFAEDLSEKGIALDSYQSYLIALWVSSTFIVHPHSARPQTETERICFILCQFLCGFLWTKVISRSTALTTSMDRHNINFHQTMDDLNSITADLQLPSELRRRLRAFFMNTKDWSKRGTWKALTGRMSPSLRTEVSYQQNRNWLMRVPYMVATSKFFIQEITVRLTDHNYSEGETFGSNFTLYIIFNGICTWYKGTAGGLKPNKTSLLTPGAVWGEEHLLLNAWHLLIPNAARSLGFSEVLSLGRSAFWTVCDEYPEYHTRLRKYFVYYTCVRGLLYEADRRRREYQKESLGGAAVSKEKTDEMDEHRSRIHKQQMQMRNTINSQDFRMTFSAPKKDESEDIEVHVERVSRKEGPSNAVFDENGQRQNSKGQALAVEDLHDKLGQAAVSLVEERLATRLDDLSSRLADTDAKIEAFQGSVSQKLMEQEQNASRIMGELAGLRKMLPELLANLQQGNIQTQPVMVVKGGRDVSGPLNACRPTSPCFIPNNRVQQ